MVLLLGLVLSWAVLCAALPYKGSFGPRLENPSAYQKPWNARPPPGQWGMGWGAPPPRRVVNTPQQSTQTPLDNRVGLDNSTSPPNRVNFVPESRNQGCQMEGVTYKVGEKWTAKDGCSRHSCIGRGKINTLGCPKMEPSELCSMSAVDARQPWPQCCPQPQCAS